MCLGAASAKDRIDVVIRNAIQSGDIPGPRFLANAREVRPLNTVSMLTSSTDNL